MVAMPQGAERATPMRRGARMAVAAPAVALALCLAVPAQARDMGGAIDRLGDTIARHADCQTGGEVLVGIFPFDEARLPLAAASAFALYEAFLGELIAATPYCVRFIDGRGAFVTLEYLGRSEMLRDNGQQQRARIRDRLGNVDFTLDGSVVETGQGLAAIFRLTEMTTGQALGRADFTVPARFRGDGCGVGALPEGPAVRGIAADLLDRTPELATIIATGGRHGPSDAATDAGRYLENRLLAELARSAENMINDTALHIRRGDKRTSPGAGEHALHLLYWPCDGDGAARLSVTLRSAEGRDVIEQRNISLASMPAGVALQPPTPAGELIVTPALASIGDEIALLAGPPPGCEPFFFNLAPSGRLTPIPLPFFRQIDLGGGLIRYEISPQWDFGLVVEEDDEPGLNRLGYLCQPARLKGDAALHGLLRTLRDRLAEAKEGLIEADGVAPIYFQTRGFKIVR